MANIPGININLNIGGFGRSSRPKKDKEKEGLKKQVTRLSSRLKMKTPSTPPKIIIKRERPIVKKIFIKEPSKTIIRKTIIQKSNNKDVSILARKLGKVEDAIKDLPHTAHSGGG